MEASLDARCPHCGQICTFDSALAGRDVSCPGCQRVFEMPDPKPRKRSRKRSQSTVPKKGEISRLKKWMGTLEDMVAQGGLPQGYADAVGLGPYQDLAKLYRKEETYELELEVLERFASQPSFAGPGQQALLDRLEKVKEQLESQRLFGPDGKGKCQECGNDPRKLAKTTAGLWVCTTCKKKLMPPRSKHLAEKWQIALARQLGFRVPDHVATLCANLYETPAS